MINNNFDSGLKAVLGPTNTGKTHYALDRMLSYKSGIFGFPLRLLARENYDKALKKVDSKLVALITGEEKILPKDAKYFFCTVESMPTLKSVDFICIDEVQLCSDFERGHIFTERILNLRGNFETILLGSMTIEKILKTLFPNISIDYRDRFSKLTYVKSQSISKLKPRSAIIAFNLDDVYSIAEQLRSQKGGSAVVLGALSPRTRNSQVEMYENKSVNYLVATDAIGMGLNLNIEHISFSSLKKYDGRLHRHLHLSEIGQIAGRAGRYKNDGTFGVSKKSYELDPISIEAIENHRFDSIEKIYWRNSDLDFNSVLSLIHSLNKNPPSNIFIKKKNAEDEKSFRALSYDTDIKKHLTTSKKIITLWNVCRIPDFQKLMTDSYTEFLKNIFINLMVNKNLIPDDLIEKHVKKLDDISGDIDMLSKRIAYIRTWTYISNQGEWIKNKQYWQERTRNIEDKLSDELHNKLKNRFVDQPGNFFLDKIKKGNNLNIKFKNDNLVETNIASIKGFNLCFNDNINSIQSNLVNSQAKKTILKMIPERIDLLIKAPDDAFNFGKLNENQMSSLPYIYWGEDPVGYLEKGESIFLPKTSVLNSELLDSHNREKISKRLERWVLNKINKLLKPIDRDTNEISNFSSIRSISYILFHNLGCAKTNDFINFKKNLSLEEKKELSKLGIRTGTQYFYFPSFMKKESIELRALLWKNYKLFSKNFLYPLPSNGRVYFNIQNEIPDDYWLAIGYVRIDKIAVRVDIYERLFFMVRKKYRFGTFIQDPDLMNLVGCDSETLKKIMLFLNYESVYMGNDQLIFILKQEKKFIKRKSDIKRRKNSFNKKTGKESFGALGAYFNK